MQFTSTELANLRRCELRIIAEHPKFVASCPTLHRQQDLVATTNPFCTLATRGISL